MIAALRNGTTADVPFIFSAWLKSYRQQPWVRAMKSEAYFRLHHNAIEAILARGVVIVATTPDDDSNILGFAVGEIRSDETVLHYLYVKQPYRKAGVGGQLLTAFAPIHFFTHHTGRIHPKLTKAAYVPHLFFI